MLATGRLRRFTFWLAVCHHPPTAANRCKKIKEVSRNRAEAKQALLHMEATHAVAPSQFTRSAAPQRAHRSRAGGGTRHTPVRVPRTPIRAPQLRRSCVGLGAGTDQMGGGAGAR